MVATSSLPSFMALVANPNSSSRLVILAFLFVSYRKERNCDDRDILEEVIVKVDKTKERLHFSCRGWRWNSKIGGVNRDPTIDRFQTGFESFDHDGDQVVEFEIDAMPLQDRDIDNNVSEIKFVDGSVYCGSSPLTKLMKKGLSTVLSVMKSFTYMVTRSSLSSTCLRYPVVYDFCLTCVIDGVLFLCCGDEWECPCLFIICLDIVEVALLTLKLVP
ncbi:unnamed protein product [Lepeophtheirus salmonis]|uniref:(salmon louse) hypothetical protein n=1 Tax=Lepeophtheirus salmonis TaxID=72036 RepID=A0A7R8H5G2_LEPSM|nr:unnamed protein product [Lepeophtheirus salmonis]CAF2882337.1 unnamed protein product [Lepeophtheirus salmonis]